MTAPAPQQESGKFVELVTLSYSGPVPRPHAPCEDPTPDEQYRQHVAQRQQQLDERQQQQQQQQAPQPEAGGFFSSAASNLRTLAQQVAIGVERATTEVTSMTETQVRQLERQLSVDRFRSTFPELSAMGEVLLADYACAAMHQGVRVSGHMHVTRNYLCFSAQTASAIAQATTAVRETLLHGAAAPTAAGIRQTVPLTEVASVQLSVALDTVDQGPPFFLPLPAPNVVPTSLQVYTTRQQLLQFLGFASIAAAAGARLSDAVKGLPIERAYNYLDHAWRASTAVPLQGVNYAA